jgi:anti-anti-sigma factor
LLASSLAMAEPTPPDAVIPTRLEISPTSKADATVLALCGELDIASAPGLERALDEFGASIPRRLVIDLTDVTFMDSTGLRALLLARSAPRTATTNCCSAPARARSSGCSS